MVGPIVKLVAEALCAADRDGYTRALAASLLGVSKSTIDKWCAPDCPNGRIPAAVVIRMASDPDILGPDAMSLMREGLLSLMGLDAVCVDAEEDDAPVMTQFDQPPPARASSGGGWSRRATSSTLVSGKRHATRARLRSASSKSCGAR